MEHEARTLVDRPVSTVYNQWTQFESFPEFMEGVSSVTQLDETSTRWDVEVGGVQRSFVADIVEQKPDDRISWRTRNEPSHHGEVRFIPRDAGTEVTLWMAFSPEGWVEKVGDRLGFVQHRVEGDLGRFKTFIESQATETGAWRGSVSDQSPDDGVTDPSRGSTNNRL